MRGWTCVLALLVLVTPVESHGSDDYFPLWEGCVWEYTDTESTLQQEVVGTELFHGYLDMKVSWEFGMGLFHVYFRELNDGDIVIHGTSVDGVDNVYDPPRPLFDLPLTVGKEWGYAGTVSEYQDGLHQTTDDVSGYWQVVGSETVTVPAGEFDVMIVREEFEEPEEVSARLPWRALAGSSKVPVISDHKVARGVGWVIIPDIWELVSYTVPVSRSTNSWGAIKALYR